MENKFNDPILRTMLSKPWCALTSHLLYGFHRGVTQIVTCTPCATAAFQKEQVTWVYFDTLNRDFCSWARFHTPNMEILCYLLSYFIPLYPKQEPLFHTQNRMNGLEKSCTSSGQSGHTKGLNEREKKV